MGHKLRGHVISEFTKKETSKIKKKPVLHITVLPLPSIEQHS